MMAMTITAQNYATDRNLRLYRKVIQITAHDSPNVLRGINQAARGMDPDNKVVLPGVLTYEQYLHRRANWSEQRQCKGLDAEFWMGKEDWLFTGDWLAHAKQAALTVKLEGPFYLGVDPAEGGDSSSFVASCRKGVAEVLSVKTPDTNEVPKRTLAMMNKWGIAPENVVFDRGGGGQQHADRLRAAGYHVRSVGFGEAPTIALKRSGVTTHLKEKIEAREDKVIYKNLRAQMYDEASQCLDPAMFGVEGYAISARFTELHRQLAAMPRLYDEEGRLYLPPKRRKSHEQEGGAGKVRTINDILGCSPDEADAYVMSVYARNHRPINRRAGAI